MSCDSVDWSNLDISNSGETTQNAAEPEKVIETDPSKEIETTNMGTQLSSLEPTADSPQLSSSPHKPSYPRIPESQKESPIKPRVIFHLIRHGQAAHNDATVPRNVAAAMHDPSLTSVGTSQCLLLHENFPQPPHNSKRDLILCSPLLRTRQTAFLAFPPSPTFPLSSTTQANDTETVETTDKGKSKAVESKRKATTVDTTKFILWPDLKELGRAQCNRGLTRSELLQELDPDIWDCTLVAEGWEDEFAETMYASEIVEGRRRHTQQVRRDLYNLAKVLIKGGRWRGLNFEKWEEERDFEVVVVSHGNFLSTLCEFDRSKFYNAEWKTVAFPTEEAMEKKGFWKSMTETSLLQVKVEVKGKMVFRGGKVVERSPRKRKLEEGGDVEGKELAVVDDAKVDEDEPVVNNP